MKFNIKSGIKQVKQEIQVGNVYEVKAAKTTAVYWIVVSLFGNKKVHGIGIDKDGDIVSAGSHKVSVLQTRRRIGFAAGINTLEIEIEYL